MFLNSSSSSRPLRPGTFTNYESAEKNKIPQARTARELEEFQFSQYLEEKALDSIDHLEKLFRQHRETSQDLAAGMPGKVLLSRAAVFAEEVAASAAPFGFLGFLKPEGAKQTAGPFGRDDHVTGVAEFDQEGRLLMLDATVGDLGQRDRGFNLTTGSDGKRSLKTFENVLVSRTNEKEYSLEDGKISLVWAWGKSQ